MPDPWSRTGFTGKGRIPAGSAGRAAAVQDTATADRRGSQNRDRARPVQAAEPPGQRGRGTRTVCDVEAGASSIVYQEPAPSHWSMAGPKYQISRQPVAASAADSASPALISPSSSTASPWPRRPSWRSAAAPPSPPPSSPAFLRCFLLRRRLLRRFLLRCFLLRWRLLRSWRDRLGQRGQIHHGVVSAEVVGLVGVGGPVVVPPLAVQQVPEPVGPPRVQADRHPEPSIGVALHHVGVGRPVVPFPGYRRGLGAHLGINGERDAGFALGSPGFDHFGLRCAWPGPAGGCRLVTRHGPGRAGQAGGPGPRSLAAIASYRGGPPGTGPAGMG